MLLELSASQALLVDSAQAFFAAQQSESGQEPSAVSRRTGWQQMAELGWAAVIADAQGCDDSAGETGVLEAALLAEQMGYALCQYPFVDAAMGCAALLRELPAGPMRDTALAGVASGSCLMSLASGDHTVKWPAEPVAIGYPVSLARRFVCDADIADDLIVVADAAGAAGGKDGPALLLVPTAAVAIEAIPVISHDPVFAITLADFVVDERHWLASGAAAATALRFALAAGGVGRAAQMVGLAQHALDLCVEHAGFREQSGRPIGGFQAIQHRLADMLRDIEGARWMAYRAAWQLDHRSVSGLGTDWRSDAAMAKAYAGEACLQAVRGAHQVMGAIGYSEEHRLHRLHKQIQAASLSYGDPTSHLDAVAAGLGRTGPDVRSVH